jgi:branched-chain amino acid aminotransferase
MLPAIEAKKLGYDQIIWTDGKTHNHVEESGTTNLFFVVDDKIILTPALDGNILEGITRDSCLKILAKEGYKIEERKIGIDEVIGYAKEGRLSDCFGTGTAAIIAKIAAIGFDGVDYELPAAETRKVSNEIYAKIYGIQTGKVADEFGWTVRV